MSNIGLSVCERYVGLRGSIFVVSLFHSFRGVLTSQYSTFTGSSKSAFGGILDLFYGPPVWYLFAFYSMVGFPVAQWRPFFLWVPLES